MKLHSLALAMLLVPGIPLVTVSAQTPSATEVPAGQLAPSDVEFIQNANSTNVAQVAMAHAAESQAVNPGVRALATKIASSHTKADQALQMLAGQKHVDLPRTANASDNSEIADLHAHKKGGDFDAQYVRNVVSDHDRMIQMYEAARNGSPDADIRRYADIMLPALRDNLQQANALAKR